MMKKTMKSWLVIGMGFFGSLMMSACSIPLGQGPVNGMLFTNVDYPGKPYSEAKAVKTSDTFCSRSFLGLVAMGDSSVQTAASSVNISKVAFVDKSYSSVLSSSTQTSCTRVSGE